MISINIMGGLGNELFMIFTTLAYGIQNNKKIVFYIPFIYKTKIICIKCKNAND